MSVRLRLPAQWAGMFQGFGDLPLQGRCDGFDSHPVHKKKARIAQLVERNLAKVEVAGSNPVSRSILKK